MLLQILLSALLSTQLVGALPTDTIVLDTSEVSDLADIPEYIPENQNLVKRLAGNVLMCTEKEFRGECVYFTVPRMDECWNFRPEWTDVVSSFIPDLESPQEVDCVLYSEPSCQGRGVIYSWILGSQGDLLFQGMDNISKSYKCVPSRATT